MSISDRRKQSNGSSSDSSTTRSSSNRRTFSRTSSSDSIFDEFTIQANNIFANLDEDRKGYLDLNILAKACEKNFSDVQLCELVTQMDRDGDGKVSVDDFRQCLKQIARRNSAIRASIRHFPNTWNHERARPTNDSSKLSLNRLNVEGKNLESREKNRDQLLRRISASLSRQGTPTYFEGQRSYSLPDLGTVGEYFERLNCQEYLYELYHLLFNGNPSLSRMYEYVLTDFVHFMQQSKLNQKRLEIQIENERSQHRADLIRLSEELDQQVQLAEDAARARERELVLAESKSQLEQKSARIDQLLERLRQLEEHQEHPEVKSNTVLLEKRLEDLQLDIGQLQQEKNRLEELLTSTRSNLAQTRSELITMRQTFQEKSRELENHISAFVEVVKENSSLKRQICLLQEVNRDLCDANDGLCAVLENKPEEAKRTRSMIHSTTASSLMPHSITQIFDNQHVKEHILGLQSAFGRGRSYSEGSGVGCAEVRSPISKFVRKPQKLGLLNTIQSGNGESRIKMRNFNSEAHQEDSGLSSLLDAPEIVSDFDVDSLACQTNHTDGHSNTESKNRIQNPTQFSNKSNASEASGDTDFRIFRVMLAGDSAVGKTSLLLRLCDDKFMGKTVSTIGIDMKMRRIEIDGRSTMLQIWDTAGQERFRSISTSFYRKADGILLVYDCTSEQSFLDTREWMSTIQDNTGREIPVAILANKIDLRSEQETHGQRCVPHDAGRKFAQEVGALFFETSAATGQNVYESAAELARLLCAQEDYNLRRPQVKLSIQSSVPKLGGRCCKN